MVSSSQFRTCIKPPLFPLRFSKNVVLSCPVLSCGYYTRLKEITAFAASAHRSAFEFSGCSSAYSGALLSAMKSSGHLDDVVSLLHRVRDDVARVSGGCQEPCFNSKLGAERVFVISVVGMLQLHGGDRPVTLRAVTDAVVKACWQQVRIHLLMAFPSWPTRQLTCVFTCACCLFTEWRQGSSLCGACVHS
jgi:hypothetical protein